VFLAPTKPLVCQQIKACYHIMGLPEDETAYLEGSVSATKREQLWKDRRVFFCTPQTLHNDLSAGICDPRSVVCVVIDEAHRATSNYSYTTVIQELSRASGRFRVLALSATPGSDIRKIQNVSSCYYKLYDLNITQTILY
jgi:ERCC4-related helicase